MIAVASRLKTAKVQRNLNFVHQAVELQKEASPYQNLGKLKYFSGGSGVWWMETVVSVACR